MPAIPYPVELGLTVLHTALYASLFLFAYLQLWLLLCYGEKRLSYRPLGLSLCLLWAALRTVLFSCYLQNSLRAGPLQRQPFPHWLLFCSPGCLLFASLCLLNLYFAEVIFKVKCAAEFNKYKVLLYLGSIFTSLLFLVVNLTCAMLIHGDVPESRLRWTVFVRELINNSLFILCAISLACCMCKLAKMSSANVYLESKMHAEEVSGEEYVVFGVVLFLWELVPTSFVVLFFRAQRLTQNLTPAGMINSHSYSSRAYFFDNPRRYDSDDDLSRLGTREGGSLATPPCSGWYGTLTGSDSCAVIPYLSGPKPDTAPLLFTCSDLEANNHHSLYSTPQN
ncbi:integral membrane protein GPR137C isoform X2 [Gopherus flavomarginatus]|uniref:integral membrane protein GPR137C isoform X2 n=1 Tax=Gopherus evgoodei TaxID=1825980 RepID=UPI0011CF123A|nr:integral membrane protein GPR137C isoform X2 [Gopherus evgoodei]XP_050810684.1 integral membrane protein GPR137C isoform X2 [Gopherus flavomarginatus]